MTIESATQPEPYVSDTNSKFHRYVSTGRCGACGQYWPCQSVLRQADIISKIVPAQDEDSQIFEALKSEHFKLHPDHKVEQFPESCSTCAAIVAYRDSQIRRPGPGFDTGVYVCSECDAIFANDALLAEHQVTAHNMTAETEADTKWEVRDAPLEDSLHTGGEVR